MIFTLKAMNNFDTSAVLHLGGKFAAKKLEAKSLSFGLADGISFKYIESVNDANRVPKFIFKVKYLSEPKVSV